MKELDDSEMWRQVHEEQQRTRAARKVENLEILRASTIPFETRNDGDVVLIRSKHYPAVDFWPSTNKWKTGGRTVLGSAVQLVEWLKRRAL